MSTEGTYYSDGILHVHSASPYTALQHYEAVASYLQLGTIQKVSDSLGIPHRTLTAWKATEWWGLIASEIQEAVETELRGKWQKLVKKAQEEAMDRLERGDEIYDGRTGKMKKVRVKARDAAVIAAMGYDKQRVSLNLPTKISQINGAEELEKLANRFIEIAQKAKEKEAADTLMGQDESGTKTG